MRSKNNDRKYIRGFQGLRGYAILLIFISHCNLWTNNKGSSATAWLGAMGVSMFIMMSGYLCVLQYGNEEIHVTRLLEKRVKRFYPLHLITLFFAIPFTLKRLFRFELESWIALFANAFLVQAWIPKASIYFSYNAVSWYLSVTIFFIVVTPLVVRLINRIHKKRQFVVMLCVIIVSEFVLCAVSRNSVNAHWAVYIFPAVRLLDYVFGGGIMCDAKIKKYGKEKFYIFDYWCDTCINDSMFNFIKC